MHFQELRDTVMKQFGWNRRLTTLAIRIAKGVESFDDIAKTPSFRHRPLLSTEEKIQIEQALRGIRQLCKLPTAKGKRDLATDGLSA